MSVSVYLSFWVHCHSLVGNTLPKHTDSAKTVVIIAFMRRVNQPRTAWTDDLCAARWAKAPAVQDFTLIYCLDNFIYTVCTDTGRSGGRQRVMDVKTASFVTVPKHFWLLLFPQRCQRKKHQLKYAGTETSAYCTICAFSMEVTWNVSSLSWCVWILQDNTPFLSPTCLFLMSGVGLNLENDGVVSVFYSIIKKKRLAYKNSTWKDMNVSSCAVSLQTAWTLLVQTPSCIFMSWNNWCPE